MNSFFLFKPSQIIYEEETIIKKQMSSNRFFLIINRPSKSHFQALIIKQSFNFFLI